MNSVTESGQGFDSISLIMSMVETAQAQYRLNVRTTVSNCIKNWTEMNKRFLFPRISNTEF